MKPFQHRRLLVPAALAGCLAVGGSAVLAQTSEPESEAEPLDRLEELPDRIGEAMRGLIDRMKPTLEDAFELMDVLGEIDSPAHYERPVVLPNGDILIRRRADAPEWSPDDEELETGPRPPHLDPNEGTPI